MDGNPLARVPADLSPPRPTVSGRVPDTKARLHKDAIVILLNNVVAGVGCGSNQVVAIDNLAAFTGTLSFLSPVRSSLSARCRQPNARHKTAGRVVRLDRWDRFRWQPVRVAELTNDLSQAATFTSTSLAVPAGIECATPDHLGRPAPTLPNTTTTQVQFSQRSPGDGDGTGNSIGLVCLSQTLIYDVYVAA